MKSLREKQEAMESFYWQLQEKITRHYGIKELGAIRAAFGVIFTYGMMEAQIGKLIQAAGLTLPGLNVLVLLSHGNPEGYPLSELSQFLVSSRANITGVIDSLVRRGFVKRVDHPNDRRVVIAQITTKGRAWLDGYFPKHAKVMSSFASPLNEKERKTLLELLSKMREGILQRVMEGSQNKGKGGGK